MSRAEPAIAFLGLLAACASSPCDSYQAKRTVRYSAPYVGHWVVARGDSLTLPQEPRLADRFRLVDVALDTTRIVVGNGCMLSGRLTFDLPRAETLAVRWFGQPEQAIVQGWPADLGPFAGMAFARYGRDSLRGSILFDRQLGVQVPAGVTAQVVAGRVP
jgi:hypothetical protein